MNSHFFVYGMQISMNRCALLNLNGIITNIFLQGDDFASKPPSLTCFGLSPCPRSTGQAFSQLR